MTAVMMTPPYIQFFDSDGVTPLSGGKVYTYTSTGGTFATAKATYTNAAGDTPAANPVELNARGIPETGNGNLWLSGTYDFKVTDANDVQVGQQLAVTAFTALGTSSTAYFQSFSGTGAQTAFTTSTDLGTDEKAIYVWVDAGAGKGYEIQNPSAYTISATTLTFASAPASGTNNIYVSSPSSLVGAASSAAADAAVSAAAAAASASAASTAETNAETAETNAETAETNAAASAAAASVSVDWATKTNGLVAATDYSSKAYAIGGTGTETNNAKYYSEQAAALVLGNILTMTEQGSTPSTPSSGDSKLYFKTDSKLYSVDDAGVEEPVGVERYPNGGYKAGVYYGGGQIGSGATAGLAADILYGVPFLVGDDVTITGISVSVDTTGTATAGRIGIYDMANGIPTSLVLDCGTVNVSGTGIKEATISKALNKGIYAMCIVFNGTVTMTQASFGSSQVTWYLLGGLTMTSGAYNSFTGSHAYAALPSTFPTVTRQTSTAPMVAIKR